MNKSAVAPVGFSGKVVTPTSPDYDQAREQYATSSFPAEDMSPGMILYATDDADVIAAIQHCQKNKIAMSVRCGGHQYCGYSSTGKRNIQLDVSLLNTTYEYHKATNTLVCGVSHALGPWAGLNHQHGIYLPMGVCAHVHLGGHVHTGGWGMVARSHGILADHVKAFDIILADGTKKHVVKPVAGQPDPDNDDLYFAVLGGSNGGCFGVVTQWEFTPIRDELHPYSACYDFVWLRTEKATRAIVTLMQEYTKKCADGTIPSDYEFMLTIVGEGKMNVLNVIRGDIVKGLERLGLLRQEGFDVYVPQMIQLWACYTNKNGKDEFDDRWFEAFANLDVGPAFLHSLALRKPTTAISYGLANLYIMGGYREMDYPFVKRSRVTKDLPASFPNSYTDRIEEITGFWGTERGLHLVSQMQIYAGGAVSANATDSKTSYSWRDQEFAMSHDAFFNTAKHKHGERHANEWQEGNDAVFVAEEGGTFSNKDLRMFAYTWGGRVLTEEWEKYYDSEEKYTRLRGIKGKVDPDEIFSPDTFAISSLLTSARSLPSGRTESTPRQRTGLLRRFTRFLSRFFRKGN